MIALSRSSTQSPAPILVHYGCGLVAPEGWLNFDASPTLRLQRVPLIGRLMPGPTFPSEVRYGDIRTGLPVAAGAAELVYCSHVLEHLSLDDVRVALRNTLALLRPGGIFRLVMPDLEHEVTKYWNGPRETRAVAFNAATLGQRTRPRGLGGAIRTALGNSEHRWMWDYDGFAQELVDAGFKGVRRAVFHDSEDRRFDPLESEARWDHCLGMQAYR